MGPARGGTGTGVHRLAALLPVALLTPPPVPLGSVNTHSLNTPHHCGWITPILLHFIQRTH